MDTRYKPGMVILAGNSHPGLAEEVARHLGTAPGSCLVYHNTNREPEYIAGLQSRIYSKQAQLSALAPKVIISGVL